MNKKVKKGFTLIELLGTIVILGIIVTIVIVVIMSIIKNSKKNTYVLTETNIVSTALTYAKENSGSFYSDDGSDIEYQCITVQELIDLGYFKKDITNSVIEFNNGTLNIDPDMRIYVDRNIETKVYGEGKLIKSQDDVLTQSCAFLDILKCPEIDSYNGTYDGNSHKITLNYLNNGLEVNYKTSSNEPWNSTEPTRINVGTTNVYVQIVNEKGQYKYCSSAQINIERKKVAKPICEEKEYNGTTQILLTENTEEDSITKGYYNNKIEGLNADTYSTTINLNSNYIWQDGSNQDYELSCSLDAKTITVKWTGGTEFEFNNTKQGPRPSATTGIPGETIILKAPKYISVGHYFTEATCVNVNKIEENCRNYELENKTIEFDIVNPTFIWEPSSSSSSSSSPSSKPSSSSSSSSSPSSKPSSSSSSSSSPSSKPSSSSSSSNSTLWIQYNDYDGSFIKRDTYNLNDEATIYSDTDETPQDSNAISITFSGWSITPNGSVVYKNGDKLTVTKKIVLYAIWTKKFERTVYFKSTIQDFTKTCNITKINDDSLSSSDSCNVTAPSVCGSDKWKYSSYSYNAGDKVYITSALNKQTFNGTLAPLKTKTQYRFRDCTKISEWTSNGYQCYPDEAAASAAVGTYTYEWATNNGANFYYSYTTSSYCANNYHEGDGNGWVKYNHKRSCTKWGNWSDWSDTKVKKSWLKDVETRDIKVCDK